MPGIAYLAECLNVCEFINLQHNIRDLLSAHQTHFPIKTF